MLYTLKSSYLPKHRYCLVNNSADSYIYKMHNLTAKMRKDNCSMRILMIAPEPFLETRGTPLSVYNRIKALLSMGHKVDLITYPIGKQVTLPGLRIYRAPALPFIHSVKIGLSPAKLPLDFLLFLTALLRLCLHRYRYIHTHEEAGVMGVIFSFLFGCKHLFDMHSDLSQVVASTKKPLLIYSINAVQKWVIKHAHTVLVVFPELQQLVKNYAPQQSAFVVENPALDEFLPPANEYDVARLRQDLQLGSAPVLLYTGTLEFYQGINTLLHSAVQVHKVYPSARYLVVGGRPEQVEKYQQLSQKLGLVNVVHFVGQRPLEEMPQYMALAHILLSPRSKGSNTPLKLYTYMASGKPILATEIHAHTQILDASTSLLVPPTPQGLTTGALELLQHPELAQRLANNAKKVKEELYSWTAFIQKNRRVYDAFMGKESGLGQAESLRNLQKIGEREAVRVR
jgi:glycosyltransferase involved in cell wall biosynthesis